MKKTKRILLSLLLLASLTLQCYIILVDATSVDEKEFVIKSSVRFTTPNQAWNLSEEEKAISLYMNSSWQTVNLLNSSHSFEDVKTDEDGNTIAILNLSNIDVEQSIEYTVFYQAVSKPRNLPNIDENITLNLTDIPSNLTKTYCRNSGTWMTNNTNLKNLAETLAGSETNVLVIIENFVDWIWGNIDYTSHEVPFYPNETYSLTKGDCDDQAILLISLCRIIGIPAYLQIGCIYMPDVNTPPTFAWNGTIENIQVRIGWHGWAMVYIPPWGWLPVDLTYIFSSKNDPINAIRTAVVTSQDVIQYMKIVDSDYVSEAQQYRDYLITNNFYIQVYDEIIPRNGEDPYIFLLELLMKNALVILLFAGIIATSVVGLFYIRRMKRKALETL